jgi:hypothetical protein
MVTWKNDLLPIIEARRTLNPALLRTQISEWRPFSVMGQKVKD